MFVVQVASLFLFLLAPVDNFFCVVDGLGLGLAFVAAFFENLGMRAFDADFILLLALDGGSSSGSGVSGLVSRKESEVEAVVEGVGSPS